MNNRLVCLGFLLLASTASAEPVTQSRTWTESYPVTTGDTQLTIKNIWGNIRVRSGATGTISVSASEERSAPTQALFDRSLEALKLDVEADTSNVSLYVGQSHERWEQRDPCPGCRVDFQFDVTVPPGTKLDVGTVTDGTIDVAGVIGAVSASNVNGPITVSALSDCDNVESVNGAVQIGFATAPGQNCNIETINGDITLHVPDGTGLDVSLDLFNGEVVTEFPVHPFALPAQVEQSVDDGRRRYKIAQAAGLRLGDGGPIFSISSLNGDIRIKKNQ